MTLVKPYKWHGGKDKLAGGIISLFPPRVRSPNKPDPADPGYLHYVEPYFGGGSVLLANDPNGISEVIGDTNAAVTNFWRVLQDEKAFAAFQRRLPQPFSEAEWERAETDAPAPDARDVARAVGFFVRVRASLAGRTDTAARSAAFTGITRTRTRRGMNAEVSAWMTAVDGLPAVAARMRRVLVRTRPAMTLIQAEDGPRTLYYLDPPYLPDTRVTVGEYGVHEMSPDDHRALLRELAGIVGRFVLSGYPNDLYDNFARRFGWRTHDFDIANHAAGGESKRRMVERVWMNY